MSHWLDAATGLLPKCSLVFFGLWTLCAHVCSLLGSGLNALRLTIPALLAVSVAGCWWLAREPAPERPAEQDEPSAPSARLALLALLGIAGLALSLTLGAALVAGWAIACVALGVAYALRLKAASFRPRALLARRDDLWFLIAAVCVAATVTLVAHRPDADDAFYLNYAASAMARPDRAALLSDEMHGVSVDIGFRPFYRWQSREMLTALLAQVLGCEPITLWHLLWPPLLAILGTLAAARVFAIFDVVGWGWRTALYVGVLIMSGETARTYGNFAFVRLFQGKAALVYVVVPLIVWLSIEYSARPSLRRWLLLALAQVAAVGLSVNGLYLGPLATALSLAACWRPARRATLTLLTGLAAVFYPLGLALASASVMAPHLTTLMRADLRPVSASVLDVLGSGWRQFFWLGALAAGWLAAGRREAARWLAGVSLGFTALGLNPFFVEYWTRWVTGAPTVWRVFWMVPLPFLLTWFLTLPLRLRPRAPRLAALLFVAGLLGFVAANGSHSTLTAANGTRLGWPTLKVMEPEYDLARAMAARVQSPARVAVPEAVAWQIVTLKAHPYVLVARVQYAQALAAELGPEEAEARVAIQEYVSGLKRPPRARRLLTDGLRRFAIRGVATPLGNPWLSEVDQTLQEAGFSRCSTQPVTGFLVFYDRPC